MARSPGRRGVRPLSVALDQITDDAPLLLSPVERAFRDLVEANGFPTPQYNVYVEGELVDVVWRDQRLVVEIDGWAFHRSKRSFAEDRRRDRELVKAGWRVVRFTAEEVTDRPEAVAAELSALLQPGGPWLLPARRGL